MHEMSLAEGVIQVLEDHAKSQSFTRVKKIWLEVGQLANVELESFRFCFDAVCRNSLAAGSKLYIDELEGSAWCLDCRKSVPIGSLRDVCPICDSVQIQVTGGQELKIRELEVE